MTYKIIRIYDEPYKPSKTIKTGLTLEEAQEWCNREDTSTNGEKPYGQNWFDGYTAEE